jgi:hypothetical protein
MVVRRLKQEDWEFEASLGFVVRHVSKKPGVWGAVSIAQE